MNLLYDEFTETTSLKNAQYTYSAFAKGNYINDGALFLGFDIAKVVNLYIQKFGSYCFMF